MKLRTLALMAIPMLAGCHTQPTSPDSPSQGAQTHAVKGKNSAQPGGGSSPTVYPIGPNVGAMTPVGGTENLNAGPSGSLTNAMKDRARSVASDASKPPATTDSNDQ